jgi:predicted negative regulator of RcsB-dependent stress response
MKSASIDTCEHTSKVSFGAQLRFQEAQEAGSHVYQLRGPALLRLVAQPLHEHLIGPELAEFGRRRARALFKIAGLQTARAQGLELLVEKVRGPVGVGRTAANGKGSDQGYADQALEWSSAAQALAREVSHPFSIAFAAEYASILHQMRGDGHSSRAHAETVVTLASEQKFAEWLPLATASRGWTLAERGELDEGIAQMRQGLATYRATGSFMFVSYFLTLLARAYLRAGQVSEARVALEEALAIVEKTEGRLWEAEIYRLQGAALLSGEAPGDATAAEACFLEALAKARQRQSRSLELRAAIDLARLWQRQGKQVEATQLLENVYSWFTEGFATADLQDAAALLQQLRAG